MREIEKQEIEIILEKQKAFFKKQITKSIPFRILQLKILKEAIQKYEKDFLVSLEKDLGKHPTESYLSEIGYIYKSIDMTIKKLPKWAKNKKKKTPFYLWPAKSYLTYEPYGSVLILGPFNYPMQLIFEPLIGSISAGNTSIVKPSELTPQTSKTIEKLLSESFDPNYITCIQGGVDTNSNLLSIPFDFIFFTGSPKVGKIVMKAAAENLTPIVLELGGKSPAIVDSTANIGIAAKRIIWGKTLNAGQTCIAPDYILVEESAKEKLIKELIQTIKDFYGEDIENNSDYGKIINEGHFQRLVTILDKDQKYLIYGGKRKIENLFIQPSILDLPNSKAASMEEEIFGPILPILTFSKLDEVFHQVESIPNPLSLYLFSQSKRVIKSVLERLPSGGVSINDTISHIANPHLPFGGVGNSGMGHYHGSENFKAFSHQKSVYHRTSGLDNSIKYPPFREKQLHLIKKIFK